MWLWPVYQIDQFKFYSKIKMDSLFHQTLAKFNISILLKILTKGRRSSSLLYSHLEKRKIKNLPQPSVPFSKPKMRSTT